MKLAIDLFPYAVFFATLFVLAFKEVVGELKTIRRCLYMVLVALDYCSACGGKHNPDSPHSPMIDE